MPAAAFASKFQITESLDAHTGLWPPAGPLVHLPSLNSPALPSLADFGTPRVFSGEMDLHPNSSRGMRSHELPARFIFTAGGQGGRCLSSPLVGDSSLDSHFT